MALAREVRAIQIIVLYPSASSASYSWVFPEIQVVIRGDGEHSSSLLSTAGSRKIFLNLRIPIIFFCSSVPSLLHCVLLDHFILSCFHSCVWASSIRAGQEHGQLGLLWKN